MQNILDKNIVIIPPMISLAERIAIVISEMEGKDRGKNTRLAVLAGTTRGRVSQWLRNPAESMSYEYARNLERTLGYSLEWLMYGKGPKMAADAKKHAPSDRFLSYVDMEEMILLDAYRHATAEGRRYILKSAELADKAPDKPSPGDK